VTHAFGVPLLHRVYPGNVPDSKQFRSITEDLVTRYREIAQSCDDVTVVFDKGNNSIEAFDTLAIKQVHFVASLKLTDFSELMDVPLTDFKSLKDRPGETAYQTQMDIWGERRNVVVVYTESFFVQQLASITQQLVKCQKQMAALVDRLTAWRQGKAKGRKPTIRSVTRNVSEILKPQFMSTVIDFEVTESDGLPELSYATNHQELRNLELRRLGRTVLCSDHHEWTAEQLVAAYRGLSNIENVFKEMKNVDFLRWQPAYHWTDDKLRVHAFYCVIALLLVSLAHKTVSESGENITPIALLKDLSAIKEVAVVYPKTDAGRPKDRITLSRLTARQRRIAERLSVDQHLISG
jgi:transposase